MASLQDDLGLLIASYEANVQVTAELADALAHGTLALVSGPHEAVLRVAVRRYQDWLTRELASLCETRARLLAGPEVPHD